MKMKKDYCKPNTRLVKLMSPFALLGTSKIQETGGGNEGGDYFEGGTLSRFAFWEDFDEDLLEDMSKEEINELD